MRQKKVTAFNELYDRYYQSLYGTIHLIVKSDPIAEEVLHDVFLKIWNKIDTYDPKKGKLFTWMINLARNSSIDKIRSKELNKELKTDQIGEYVSTSIEDYNNQIKEDHIGVNTLLEKLDQDQKLVFDLIYYQGFTHSEVAKEYDIPLGTVKTRIRKGLQILRKYLSVE